MRPLSATSPLSLLAFLARSTLAAPLDSNVLSDTLIHQGILQTLSSLSTNGTELSNGTLSIGELGSDGGGGALRYVWAVYCILIGAPLLLCGIRITKFTCGAGCCLPICISLWAALVNSTPFEGYSSTPLRSDLAILIPTIVLSLAALALGWLQAFRYIGHLLLSSVAGVALVLQVMLFKEALLVPSLIGTWLLMGGLGFGCLVLGIWHQRPGVIFASTMSGAFLLSLAVNLILERESGMSYGLRVILDGNACALGREDYKPTLSTQVNLAVGLGLVLLMSIIQHFAFPGDFIRRPKPTIWPQLPPSHGDGRATPFSAFGRRASVASSFEAVTPQDVAYQRPWMMPGAESKHAHSSTVEKPHTPVDPIPIDVIPSAPMRNGSYATISLHQDSPYALSTAELRAKEIVPPVPARLDSINESTSLPTTRALLHPHPTRVEAPHQHYWTSQPHSTPGSDAQYATSVKRTPSSASSISQYPPTPARQSGFHRPFSQHPSRDVDRSPVHTPYQDPYYPRSVPPSAYAQPTTSAATHRSNIARKLSNPFDDIPTNGREYTPPNSKSDLLGAIQGLYTAGEERRAPPSSSRPFGQEMMPRFQPPSQTRF